MEKAAGKYYGTFEQMDGGWMDESIYAITGVPSMQFRHEQVSAGDAWNMFVKFDQKKYIMTCANFNDVYGLVPGHAYTLIGTAVYNGTKLVKVRNPWGSEGYNGPWNDNSSEMRNAKNALGHTTGGDGTFWMPLDTFHKTFYNTIVGEYRNWATDAKKVNWNRTTAGRSSLKWTTTNTQQQDVVFGIQGPSRRHFMQDGCKSRYRMESLQFRITNSNG
jgi:hypothetical protein